MSTDDTTPTPTPTGHPDFEVLSAHFDGEAPEVAGHVAGCAECRLKLRWLRNAHDLVANPVPPVAASAREAALARAGTVFESLQKATEAPVMAAAPVPSPVSVPPRVAPAPVPITVARDRRERRKGGSGVWVGLGSVAAVVVALVVGVGVLGGNSGRDDTTTFASGSTQERAGDSPYDAVGSTIEAAGGGTSGGGVNGGDLGELADATTLAARARPALTQRQAALAAPAPQSAPSALGSSDADLTPKVVGTRPCEMEVRAARPGLGTVVYYATGRVDGAPVVVLGFEGATSPPTVTLLALVQAEGCRVVLEAAGP